MKNISEYRVRLPGHILAYSGIEAQWLLYDARIKIASLVCDKQRPRFVTILLHLVDGSIIGITLLLQTLPASKKGKRSSEGNEAC